MPNLVHRSRARRRPHVAQLSTRRQSLRTPMPSLVIRNVPEGARYLPLDTDVFSIGRSADNDLVLSDALVSRRHSEILRRGEEYRVRDLRSANGTYVNGLRVESALLQDGDELLIGQTALLFESADPEPDAETVLAVESSALTAGLLPDDQRFDVRESIRNGTTPPALTAAAGGLEREKERFALLYQIGKAVLGARSLDDVLQVALSLVFDCIQAERGVLLLQDASSGDMVARLA